LALVTFAGQDTVGAWVSFTITLNEQVPGLPLASVAKHVTVVVPFANVAPLAGTQVTPPTPGQLSVAVGVE
jgi:hypothetical protein